MKKLSELPHNTVIIIESFGKHENDICITKEQFLLDVSEYQDIDIVFIADVEVSKFGWQELFESEEENAQEDFAKYVANEISDDEWEILNKSAEIVNAAYQKYPTYWTGEIVYVDIKKQEEGAE